ncbi:MAG: hypothetical protein ACRCX2_32235 [Paraclostridium sp.]
MNINIQEIYNLFISQARHRDIYFDLTTYLKAKGIHFESGTKRIVIDRDSNTVYKMGFQPAGVQDNIQDLLSSWVIRDRLSKDPKFREKFEHGIILSTQSEFMDPAIIICEKMEPLKNSQPIKKLVDSGMSIFSALKNLRDTNPDMKKQVENIGVLLSSLTEHADTDYDTAPLNYGLRYIGGKAYTCIGDIGSVIPRMNNMRPKCPMCGKNMYKYVPNTPTAVKEVQERNSGFYSCENPNCECNLLGDGKIQMAPAQFIMDVVVVHNYMMENKKLLDTLIAGIIPTEWKPSTVITTPFEYRNAFFSAFPSLEGRFPMSTLETMYQTYTKNIQEIKSDSLNATIVGFRPNALNHIGYREFVTSLFQSLNVPTQQYASMHNQYKQIIDVSYVRYTYEKLPQVAQSISRMGTQSYPVFMNNLRQIGFNADDITYSVLFSCK